MANKYKDLKINGVEDKEGFKIVHEAQMILRDARITIEKTRKEYTRQFDEAKKTALDLEKELLLIITPIEENLKAQKEQIEAEKERIKEEERLEKERILKGRIEKLSELEYVYSDLYRLSQMNEIDFLAIVASAESEYKIKEALRKVEEEEKLEAERLEKERLEKEKKEREEFEAKQKAFEEEQKKLEDEKRKLQEEKDRIQREKDIEEARKQWEEKAKKDAEAEALRKAEEERIKAENEKAELEKKKKYQTFLKDNEGNFDKIVKEDWIIVLYKKIAEFKI